MISLAICGIILGLMNLALIGAIITLKYKRA